MRQRKRGSDTASQVLFLPKTKTTQNKKPLVSQNSQGAAPAQEAGADGADTAASWSSEDNPNS